MYWSVTQDGRNSSTAPSAQPPILPLSTWLGRTSLTSTGRGGWSISGLQPPISPPLSSPGTNPQTEVVTLGAIEMAVDAANLILERLDRLCEAVERIATALEVEYEEENGE